MLWLNHWLSFPTLGVGSRTGNPLMELLKPRHLLFGDLRSRRFNTDSGKILILEKRLLTSETASI